MMGVCETATCCCEFGQDIRKGSFANPYPIIIWKGKICKLFGKFRKNAGMGRMFVLYFTLLR